MKTDQDYYELHLFICTHEKVNGGCGSKGGQALVDDLKSWSKTADLKKRVRVNKSGCLGRCDEGITCVAYPRGEWMTEVKAQDADVLKKWVKGHCD